VASPTAGLFSEELWSENIALAEASLSSPFVQGIASGTLSPSRYWFYLCQDEIYLSAYARAFAVLAAKTRDSKVFIQLIKAAAGALDEHLQEHNREEMSGRAKEAHHARQVLRTATVGCYDARLNATSITQQYTDLLEATAWKNGIVVGLAATLPCQKLYNWIGLTLANNSSPVIDNPYDFWIEMYSTRETTLATQSLERLLDTFAATASPAELADARHAYRSAIAYEYEFFKAAFDG
jgi:thiaminase